MSEYNKKRVYFHFFTNFSIVDIFVMNDNQEDEEKKSVRPGVWKINALEDDVAVFALYLKLEMDKKAALEKQAAEAKQSGRRTRGVGLSTIPGTAENIYGYAKTIIAILKLKANPNDDEVL